MKRGWKAKGFSICILSYFIIIIMITSIAYGLYNKTSNSDLKSWIGEYTFEENTSVSDGTIMAMEYHVDVYKENKGRYYADIAIDGQTTLARIRAVIFGDY